MRKRKVKIFLFGMAAILSISLGLAYWAMNVAVNKIVLAVGSDLTEARSSSLENVQPRLSSSSTEDESKTPTPIPVLGKESTTPIDKEDIKSNNGNDKQSTGEAKTKPEDQVVTNPKADPPPNSNHQESGSSLLNGSSSEYNPNISVKKAKEAQVEISLKEKLLITSVFMKRFSPKELESFAELASGGITKEEKKQAKKIILQKLSEKEYNQLIAIAARLGLSQGKSYKETARK